MPKHHSGLEQAFSKENNKHIPFHSKKKKENGKKKTFAEAFRKAK